MDVDADKIDEAVLALLYLTLRDGFGSGKATIGTRWGRLHRKGMIGDPIGKVKSESERCSGSCSADRRHGCGDDQAAAAIGGWKFQGRSSSSRLMG